MREIRLSGSEGGPNPIGSPYPYQGVHFRRGVPKRSATRYTPLNEDFVLVARRPTWGRLLNRPAACPERVSPNPESLDPKREFRAGKPKVPRSANSQNGKVGHFATLFAVFHRAGPKCHPQSIHSRRDKKSVAFVSFVSIVSFWPATLEG